MIIQLKNGDSVVEIEEFNQAENGGEGITYTLYYYPQGLSEDFDLNSLESFDSLKEAIKKAKKLLKPKIT